MPAILSTVSAGNSIAVTQQLLNALKVPFTYRGINDSLKQHPDYPSIAAAHDVLKEYQVENLVLKIEPGKLDELPLPFIAHVNGQNRGFITVTGVSKDSVIFLKKGSLLQTEVKSREDFLKEWSGVALLAEKTENAGEKNYKVNRRNERLNNLRTAFLLISFLFILIFSLLSSTSLSFSIAAVTILKLAGVAVSCLLLWYEIDKTNPLLQKVCSGSKTTNCSAILQSKEAKLFGIISWSEIGFFYFPGGLLFVISTQEKSLQPLAWLNLLALPYTVFSVYYQGRIAKQWCPLCLTVQAILLLEAVVFFIGSHHQAVSFNLSLSNSFLFAFALPVLFWLFVKPYLLNSKEGEEYKNRFFRMKKDTGIFEALLSKQKRINASADGLGITLGNPHAEHTIIKVCNPYCGPCAKSHPLIHELIKDNDNIKVQILFIASPDENDYRNNPVKHLLAIGEKNDGALIDRALDDWYLAEKKDYDVFAAKYPMNGELKQQEKKVKAMKDWCDEVKIEFTPTFFVNGHQLPENYNIDELKHFLSS